VKSAVKHINVRSSGRGSVLAWALIASISMAIASVSIFQLSLHRFRTEHGRVNSADAYYTAETILLEGAQMIAEGSRDSDFVGEYTLSGSPMPLSLPYTPGSEVEAASLKIENDDLSADHFRVTASARVGGKTRTLQGLVEKRALSEVFDYIYFINNWAWMTAAQTYMYGDVRSNWDFDFRNRPTIWGHVFAHGDISDSDATIWRPGDPSPVTGRAENPDVGQTAADYLHVGVSRLKMAHLKDFSYYEAKAIKTGGTIKQNGAVLVAGVQGDDEPKSGIYLDGTKNAIDISGTVVVRGDVILKGEITGRGTLYIGGNLYIADDVTYKNGPDFAQLRTIMENAKKDSTEGTRLKERNEWVDRFFNRDLITFAAREGILAGNVNSKGWYNIYSADEWGLKNYGSEQNLGADGIHGTGDDASEPTWYDVDDDGNGKNPGEHDYYNYQYAVDIEMTTTRMANIQGYPTTKKKAPEDYSQLSTDNFSAMQGIYYTEHAFAFYSKKKFDLDGAAICRDEAWNPGGKTTCTYDDRIHSRHHKKYYDGDPNRIIDLDFPAATSVRFLNRYEMAYK